MGTMTATQETTCPIDGSVLKDVSSPDEPSQFLCPCCGWRGARSSLTPRSNSVAAGAAVGRSRMRAISQTDRGVQRLGERLGQGRNRVIDDSTQRLTLRPFRTGEAGTATATAAAVETAPPVGAAAPIELFYDGIADEFDRIMNRYDLERRVDTIFDVLLGGIDLAGRSLLDAGCGTGWFSARACRRGAKVTALDIGPRLLDQVRRKCPARTVRGDVLNLEFGDGTFDVVISSECIEHTRDPQRAVHELIRVCRPGGLIAITCPNHFWYWLCAVANHLHLRPYEGLEDWPRW